MRHKNIFLNINFIFLKDKFLKIVSSLLISWSNSAIFSEKKMRIALKVAQLKMTFLKKNYHSVLKKLLQKITISPCFSSLCPAALFQSSTNFYWGLICLRNYANHALLFFSLKKGILLKM